MLTLATRIYRYEVPVDDQVHEFRLHGSPLSVGCRKADVVEFWAVHLDDDEMQRVLSPGREMPPRRFRVVGTGHPIPERMPLHDGWRYIGTAVAPGGALVWHLIEVAT